MSDSSTAGRSDSFRPVLGATVLLFLAVLAVAGVRSWRDLEAARQREQLLESRITETEAQIARLRNRIERLRSDPGTLERRAREDLGMVRPGDVVIELPASPPGPLSHRPSPAFGRPNRERGNAPGTTPQQATPSAPPPASVQTAPPQASTPQRVPEAGFLPPLPAGGGAMGEGGRGGEVTPVGGPPARPAPAS